MAPMRIRTFENRAFILLVALVTLAFLWMLRPFMLVVFWAAVLAVLFRGAYQSYLDMMPRWRNTAAALTLITAIVFLIAPLIALSVAVTREVLTLYQGLAQGAVDVQAPLLWIEQQLPLVSEQLARVGIDPTRVRDTAIGTAAAVSGYLASQVLVLGQNAVMFLGYFSLMLYTLFFFIRDGDRIVDLLIKALPLGDMRERRLFERFVVVSRATVKGTLVVAAVQGALGGLLFWIVGLPAPVLWGTLMAVLSLLPVVGTVLVWGPGAIYLLSVGQIWQGVFVLAGGFLVVGLVDNILRPILVGRDTQIPDYIVLLATIGGLAKFGLSGFVAGPMLAAFFLVVWQMFAEEFGALDMPGVDEDAEPDPDVPGPGSGTPTSATPTSVELSEEAPVAPPPVS